MATLARLAELVQGQVEGDPETEIEGVAPIDQAGVGAITFVATRNTCHDWQPAKPRPSLSIRALKLPAKTWLSVPIPIWHSPKF